MKRRQFLEVVTAAGTAVAAGPGSTAVAAEEPKKEAGSGKPLAKEATSPRDLAGYCGRFCGKCNICGLNIERSIGALRNVVETVDFPRAAEGLGWRQMREIAATYCAEFEQNMDSFAHLAPRLFPSHCRGGCVPPCEIAACCKEKGRESCAECPKMDSCPKLARVAEKHPWVMENLKQIKKVGLDAWAKRQFEEVTKKRKEALVAAVNRAFG